MTISQSLGQSRRELSPSQFSLASLFLLLTLVSVCLALLRWNMPLGIVFCSVAVSAGVRTFLVMVYERQQGCRSGWDGATREYCHSLLIVMVVYLHVAAAALCAAVSIVPLYGFIRQMSVAAVLTLVLMVAAGAGVGLKMLRLTRPSEF